MNPLAEFESIDDVRAVEIETYRSDTSNAQFVLYSMVEGGHYWFDNSWPVDINQKQIEFFKQYRLCGDVGDRDIQPLGDFNMDCIIDGDINNDENINVQDVVLMVNQILANEYSVVADLNGDDSTNVQDIVMLINLILD